MHPTYCSRVLAHPRVTCLSLQVPKHGKTKRPRCSKPSRRRRMAAVEKWWCCGAGSISSERTIHTVESWDNGG